ncbi:MAG: sulfotransferase [Planctomycetota bacterium]|nr:sulfotransferase [Planctomycetota bacterium]
MKVFYLVGDSRSGSTLLQHLLALQEGVHALGEVRRMGAMAQSGEPCACGETLLACPYWTQIAKDLGVEVEQIVTEIPREKENWRGGFFREIASLKMGRLSPPGLQPRSARAVADQCAGIYRATSEKSGDGVLVDSSKDPDHFLHLMARLPGLIKPVFLLRDGRGIVWSRMQRAGVEVDQAINGFLWMCRLISWARRAVPASARLDVRYEDVCQDPEAEVARILEESGVLKGDVLVDLKRLPKERHDLGGSPSFLKKRPSKIALDERWRTEMPSADLEVFERRAGMVNRALGYS